MTAVPILDASTLYKTNEIKKTYLGRFRRTMKKLINVLLGICLAGVVMVRAEPAQQPTQDVGENDKPRLVVQSGHVREVTHVGFSPDGKLVASTGEDGELKLWDTATGREIRTYGSGKSGFTFSADGHTLISEYLIYDVASGNLLLRRDVPYAGSSNTVAFSPDGKDVVAGRHYPEILLSDVQTAKVWGVFRGHKDAINSVAYFPKGNKFVSGSADKTIKLWDATVTDRIRGALEFERKELLTYTGHKEGVTSVAVSQDGLTVASGSADKTVKLWDAATGKELRTLTGHNEGVTSVAFSPDGQTVISGSKDRLVKVWDVKTGVELRSFRYEHKDKSPVDYWGDTHPKTARQTSEYLMGYAINSVVFSPDGMTIAAGNSDGTLKLWDTSSGRELQTISGKIAYVKNSSFLADALTLVSYDKGDQVHYHWDLASGQERRTLEGNAQESFHTAFSPDRKIAVSQSSSSKDGKARLVVWDAFTGQQLNTLAGHDYGVHELVFSADGKTIVSGGADKASSGGINHLVKLWDVDSGKLLQTFAGHTDVFQGVGISPNGKIVVSGSADKTIKFWDAGTGRELTSIDGYAGMVDRVVFSPDGKTIALAGNWDEPLKLLDAVTGRELYTLLTMLTNRNSDHEVAFSPDGKRLVSRSGGVLSDGYIVWDVNTGNKLTTRAHSATYRSGVAFSPDGKTIATGGELWNTDTGRTLGVLQNMKSPSFSADGKTLATVTNNTVELWRVADGVLMATLYSFTDGTWLVTDPEGRFDTADLEEIEGLHWVMPDAPLTPVPLEAFMKDYYEPRLLARILNGEKFKPLRTLMDLNRVQPQVKIVSITADSKDAERAVVEVEVEGAAMDYDRNGKKVSMVTAANDLRLFRDGQLVGYVDGQVVKQGAKPYRKTFNVHLPSAMSGKDITFSSYAFNDDRVKSQTARQTYQVPTAVVVKKGNAYLITMGVNRFENSSWNLRFAANDARLMRQSLTAKLEKTAAYQRVVPLSLISDETEHRADKALLHAILDRLAGKPASPLLKKLPGAEQLQPATPDDLVLLTFAGHGYADDSGDFYLLTQDTGPGTGKVVNAGLLKRSISSEELSQWLKDVDAGDMTLIVDACQSAASVQGKDFKPGPMGSRGLGQLSFDKGMRILAASQADEYALEDNRLQQGLLSFALVTNGIEGFEADHEPKDQRIMLNEWLHYGVSRVPGLAEEVKTGTVKVASRGGERSLIRVNKTGTSKPRPAQQPALFDFAKKRRPVEIAGE